MTDEVLSGPEITTSDNAAHDATAMAWHEANQRHLSAALSALRIHLEASLASRDSSPVPHAEMEIGWDAAAWAFSQPPALEQLCSSFELSSFERIILLLCAGAEMNTGLAKLYASLDVNGRPLPTFNLALTTIPNAHWSALSPARPLRFWQFVEWLPADTLVSSPLRINERILHYLAGVSSIDERLQSVVCPVPHPGALPSSYCEVSRTIADIWADAASTPRLSSASPKLPVIELCGPEADAKRTIAAAAAILLDLRLFALFPRSLPQAYTSETSLLLRLWEREAVLTGSALLIELDDRNAPDAAAAAPLVHLLESVHTPLILSTYQPHANIGRPHVVIYTGKPTRDEQTEIWHNCLGGRNLDETVDALVSQFNLTPVAIRSAAYRADGATRVGNSASSIDRLWNACRLEARPRLEGLAQRIEDASHWHDLVLPEKELEMLHRIILHVKQRSRVYESWGFSSKGSRGLGISALFAGASGTGKTMAAEILAHELRLDLFRIDLSQVVSKYIGETEKNLSQVFDAAEGGAAILLFDEADALFGKRSEIKDSHDRYANVEVSYLLQRMEAYRGLAILTTNRKSALDTAFLRRIRFVVDFPFPESAQRAEMWRRVFPTLTPTESLNVDKLARLRVTGGNIHNIAMGAAFLAAGAGQPVRMEHLLSSARAEFAKLETPLTDAEVAGWA
jgi:hypothetical protein